MNLDPEGAGAALVRGSTLLYGVASTGVRRLLAWGVRDILGCLEALECPAGLGWWRGLTRVGVCSGARRVDRLTLGDE